MTCCAWPLKAQEVCGEAGACSPPLQAAERVRYSWAEAWPGLSRASCGWHAETQRRLRCITAQCNARSLQRHTHPARPYATIAIEYPAGLACWVACCADADAASAADWAAWQSRSRASRPVTIWAVASTSASTLLRSRSSSAAICDLTLSDILRAWQCLNDNMSWVLSMAVLGQDDNLGLAERCCDTWK